MRNRPFTLANGVMLMLGMAGPAVGDAATRARRIVESDDAAGAGQTPVLRVPGFARFGTFVKQ
jgi:hypothetical protein